MMKNKQKKNMNFANKTVKYAKKHNIYKKARENKLQ